MTLFSMEIKIWLLCLVTFTFTQGQSSGYGSYEWRPMKTGPSHSAGVGTPSTTTSYFTMGGSTLYQDDSRSEKDHFEPMSRDYADSSRHYPDSSRHYPDSSRHYSDDSRHYPGSSRQYPDNSRKYPDSSRLYPDDSRHYGDDSYSSDFKSPPQVYSNPVALDQSASFEEYGYGPLEEVNVTLERLGGFGGTGDTRGFGAYDYPKKEPELSDYPKENHAAYDFPTEHPGIYGYPEEQAKIFPEPVMPTSFPDIMRVGRSRNSFHRHNPPPYLRPLPPPL